MTTGTELHIKLGSGKVQNRGAGNKGALLDKAAQAGINVPKGVLILDTTWDQAVLYGYLVMEPAQVYIPNPEKLLKFLELPHFTKPVAVRSAFSAEDGHDESLAGYFDSVLHVNLNHPEQFAEAISKVLKSSFRREGRFRQDVLIMEMVAAKHAGVAFTEREHEDDLVNYTDSTAEDLVAGKIEGESIPLAKLRSWEEKIRDEDLPDWQNRLQQLLRDTRRWLGKQKDWDIEWADDGTTCYLVQARPVTRPTRRNEAFTIANHKEILPELPSPLMTSVVAACADDLFAYYRNFDPTLPKNRPFIEVFYGRPYINLSLLSEMMRIFGLPTNLVTDNIGGSTDRVYGVNFPRMVSKSLSLTLPRFAWAQFRSVSHARRTTQKMLARTENPGESFTELVETLRWLYTTLVQEMFSLTAAIGPALSLLRQFDVLTEHSARQQTISTQMYTDLTPLRDYVAEHEDVRTALEQGTLPDEPTFMALWQTYLEKYGHRGIYESDIARPRYADDPTPLLHSTLIPTNHQSPNLQRTLKGTFTLPIWWQAGRTMRAREQWRHDAMLGFQRVRDALVKLAQIKVDEGILPDVDSLWLMHIDEVRKLDAGWQPGSAFFNARHNDLERLRHMHLPDLFRRYDALEHFRENAGETTPATHLHGISLTNGTVQGKAWVLREPATTLPDGFSEAETILIARSVDAGWISTFSRVAGVVVETGGDLSHGSIILREIGLPAITNVSQVTQHIQTGDQVELRAGSGVVERLSSGEIIKTDEALVEAQQGVILQPD